MVDRMGKVTKSFGREIIKKRLAMFGNIRDWITGDRNMPVLITKCEFESIRAEYEEWIKLHKYIGDGWDE